MRAEEILGWRRTALVRLVDDGHAMRAEVLGQAHRLPRAASIPLATAARLIAAGVPSVVSSRSGG